MFHQLQALRNTDISSGVSGGFAGHVNRLTHLYPGICLCILSEPQTTQSGNLVSHYSIPFIGLLVDYALTKAEELGRPELHS
jgi:hypothetical protein